MPAALKLCPPRSRRLLSPGLAGGLLCAAMLLVLSTPAYPGLVDFSKGLLEHVKQRFGPEAPKRLLQMQQAVQQFRATAGKDFSKSLQQASDVQPAMTILRRVNDFYNRVPYFTDQEHWNQADYWATPVEFVGSAGGDCEDYAIAKYMTLKELGVPADKMRITYVRATQIGETHMVLAYYPTLNADPWILDNLVDEVQPASQRSDLIPVYSFNDDDLWLGGNNRKGAASTVRLWKEVIEKMERERRM
ncbi:transglutaminase-like cysteine peptidase [Undibacterium crateris]|uniref:transglutaminase-like cysteine peptidase n=1 Tax=Undibacterium crateris TaxID=2528175 RepID=UPI00192E7FF3|nr:transglutaminase-like cysteine peptidase [Undibacterium crateris]